MIRVSEVPLKSKTGNCFERNNEKYAASVVESLDSL